jgi:hypothetical protein
MAFSFGNQTYTDKALNRFSKTNLYFTTNPYLLFQDPTYLGFKLFFVFDGPDSKLLGSEKNPNSALGYLKNIGDTQRYNYLKSFKDHLQKINLEIPWFFQEVVGLGDAWKHGYQEAEYKPKLGEDRKIAIKCLESIDLRMTALIDLYRKACFDWNYRREIVPKNLRQFTVYIYVYEARTINYKGTPRSNSAIDVKKVIGLPEINQRQVDQNAFMLGIDQDPGGDFVNRLSDAGGDVVSGLKSAFAPPSVNDITDAPNIDINRIMFKFDLCEILPDESGVIVEKASNIISEPATQTVSFSYRNVTEENIYNLFHGASVTDLNFVLDNVALDAPITSENYSNKWNQAKKKVFGRIGGFDMDSVLNGNFNSLTPFASIAADRATDFAASYAKGLLLGNIYGFSAANVAGAAQSILSGDPSTMVQGAVNTAQQIQGGGASTRNDTNNIDQVSKYYDRVTPNDNGPDSKPQGNANPRASESNYDESTKSKSQSTGNPTSSLSNDTGPDSKPQGNANPEASKANDKGPDSKSQATADPRASLNNDNGPDSKPQGTGNPTASLNNDNGPDSKTQGTGNPTASLSNDNGSDSKPQGTGNPTASLNNDNGSDSKTQGTGNPTASLNNDNGSDSKPQGTGNDRASLNNDNGPDSKPQGTGNGEASLNNR